MLMSQIQLIVLHCQAILKQMVKKSNDPKELIKLNKYHSFLSMLYIACQVKDENLDEHERTPILPALSS